MDIFRVFGLAAITALLSLTVRQIRPEMGMQTALAGGLIILGVAAAELSGLSEQFLRLSQEAGLDGSVLRVVLKIVGIAYMTEISGSVCRDAGESALAVKTEICGRLMLLSAAAPSLLSLITKLASLIGDSL